MIKQILCDFLESIRQYERESRNLIGFDERENSEFVDTYLSQYSVENEYNTDICEFA